VNRRQFLGGLLATACIAPFSSAFGYAAPASAALPFQLTDITASAGIRFEHNTGAFGGKYLPETLGSGCAFLDYDADGWLDILLMNGMDWPGHSSRR
jgi:hypothetical protein